MGFRSIAREFEMLQMYSALFCAEPLPSFQTFAYSMVLKENHTSFLYGWYWMYAALSAYK